MSGRYPQPSRGRRAGWRWAKRPPRRPDASANNVAICHFLGGRFRETDASVDTIIRSSRKTWLDGRFRGSGWETVVAWILHKNTVMVPGCNVSSKGHSLSSALYL
jgi:hypothetical protein